MVLVSRFSIFLGSAPSPPGRPAAEKAARRPAGAARAALPPLLLLALLSGCGHDVPRLPGFDAAAWRADPYACQNRRAAQLPALLRAREQLYDTRANAIDALLGHPDEEELRAQTEKVYYYYLAPGAQCQPAHQRSAAPRLSLRFGPLGTVTEILADPLPPSRPPTTLN